MGAKLPKPFGLLFRGLLFSTYYNNLRSPRPFKRGVLEVLFNPPPLY